MTYLAIGRGDVANYVDALFTVFVIMVIAYVVLAWVQAFRPIPYVMPIRAVTGFIEECVEPYLGIFRRWIPPLGGGGFQLDLSPVIGIILLLILQGVVVDLIAG